MFLQRLLQLCEASGLSQAELSRLCLFRRSYLSNVVRDPKAEMGRSRLIAFALTVGCSLDYLVLGQGEPPTQDAVREAIARAQRNPARHKREIDAALGITRAPRARASKRTAAAAATHRPRRAKPLPRITPAPEARS